MSNILGEEPGIGNITQPIMFCNVFCDYFADNNKIQPNVYFGDAKQTIKSLSEICDQMGEENKLGSWDAILSLICLRVEAISSKVSECFSVALNTKEMHLTAEVPEPGKRAKC